MASRQPPLQTSIADIALESPDHDAVVLGDRIEVPTIVILARYFG